MRARRGRSAVLIPLLVAGLATWTAGASAETAEGTDTFETPRSLVGSYLAGRFARAQHDTKEAAEFYRNALAFDPANELLLEQAFQTEASRANWPSAFLYAEELVSIQPQNRMAHLALALAQFQKGAYDKAEEHFKAAGGGPIGELTSALATAWVKLAKGDTKAALQRLDLPKQAEWAQFFLRYHRALIADLAGKKKEAAEGWEAAFKQDARTLRTALAYARHALATGDRKLAESIVKEQLERSAGDGHPLLRSLASDIKSGRKLGLIVSTPAEGLAEAFYGLGEALTNEGAVGVGTLYLQMALFAQPDQQFALAALASAYETTKDYADAIATYERIPATSPLATAVEIRKALNLNSLEKVDEARDTLLKILNETPKTEAKAEQEEKATETGKAAGETGSDPLPRGEVLKLRSRGERVTTLQEALKALGYDIVPDGTFGDDTRKAVLDFQKKNGVKQDGLAGPKTYAAILAAKGGEAAQGKSKEETTSAGDLRLPLTVSDKLEILDSLGNIMRSRKQYAEAIPYYDKALALIEKPEKRHWVYYYARGTSYERLKNWPAAEADLLKALSLYPDQPLILNYLGYSWIDQGRNLKEGMTYIEKAVTLKPDDGYIVDSLGWAHFKQGNFKEAVRYLERAVELKPDDPVLNEHLGDALWRVGREREARYQWDQALTLKPEPEDLEKLKHKLEHGLEKLEKTTAGTGKQASELRDPTAQ